MDEVKKYLSEIGKKGGQKTAKKGKEHFKAIGLKGANKRWGEKKSE
jgi:general stress protein YciG